MNNHLAACAQKTLRVSREDLPLSCPADNMVQWNGHPKVYLPIEKTGKAKCEYCGTEYILKNDKS